jgi:hypothetical protein
VYRLTHKHALGAFEAPTKGHSTSSFGALSEPGTCHPAQPNVPTKLQQEQLHECLPVEPPAKSNAHGTATSLSHLYGPCVQDQLESIPSWQNSARKPSQMRTVQLLPSVKCRVLVCKTSRKHIPSEKGKHKKQTAN